jgi:hypothetical protein
MTRTRSSLGDPCRSGSPLPLGDIRLKAITAAAAAAKIHHSSAGCRTTVAFRR